MPDAHFEIVPAIGIARVGNAPESFYIGPEQAGALPVFPDDETRPFGAGDFRDAEGRLKRQAARFRILRYEAGKAPEEITLGHPDIAEIRWRVHLANKKAAWHCFQCLKGQAGYAPNHPFRNPKIEGNAARRALIIDAGPRSIAGRNAGRSEPVEFSRGTIPSSYRGGSFPPAALHPQAIDTLGALQTDQQGRLLVLGGFGHSGTLDDPPRLAEYANNDGWWDDTSDGSVRAELVLKNGETIAAKAASVIVAPPAYAPQICNLVTLYDTMFDTAARHLGLRPDIYANGSWRSGADGYRPNFDRDVKPIFERTSGYAWVSPIPRGPHRFDYAKLADPGPSGREDRQFFLSIMRGPGEQNIAESHVPGVSMMPLLIGDDAIGAEEESGALKTTSRYLALTDTQYFFLQQWAAGHFDTNTLAEPDSGLAITKGVLENCVGGAFSPGIETGWIARDPQIFAEPFRIKQRPVTDEGLSPVHDAASGLEPGDLTGRMALPWQADFNECAAQNILGRAMWWWPAQRPITVFLPAPAGKGKAKPAGQRVPWIGTDGDHDARKNFVFPSHVEMVENWDKLGFVLDQGEAGAPKFVEVARTLPRSKPEVT